MNNIHFIGEWFDCRIPNAALAEPETIHALCVKHASHRSIPIVYAHFTRSVEAGVIGAMTASGMHLVVRTFPRHSSVIVDLFVGHHHPADITSAMQVIDALRDDLWPMRALLHRVQYGEGTHRCGRHPVSPTEVLLGPVSIQRQPRPSQQPTHAAPKATVHPIRPARPAAKAPAALPSAIARTGRARP